MASRPWPSNAGWSAGRSAPSYAPARRSTLRSRRGRFRGRGGSADSVALERVDALLELLEVVGEPVALADLEQEERRREREQRDDEPAAAWRFAHASAA
jgi:hypothetical protein